MQILLANAKIMHDKAERPAISIPLFQSVANELAAEMAMMDIDELARQLDKAFSCEGFDYSPDHGEELFPHFIWE